MTIKETIINIIAAMIVFPFVVCNWIEDLIDELKEPIAADRKNRHEF